MEITLVPSRPARADALRAAALVFARQHGVATRVQLLECGMTIRQIERRVAEGRFDSLARGVYAVRALPDSWERRAAAAVLYTQVRAHPGALSHESAAAAWQLPGFVRQGEIRVTAPLDDRRRNPLASMVRTADLAPSDVVTGPLGVPTTTPVRTVLDLAVRAAVPAHVDELLDRVLDDGRVPLDALRHRAGPMAGRPGIVALRRSLDRRTRRLAA